MQFLSAKGTSPATKRLYLCPSSTSSILAFLKTSRMQRYFSNIVFVRLSCSTSDNWFIVKNFFKSKLSLLDKRMTPSSPIITYGYSLFDTSSIRRAFKQPKGCSRLYRISNASSSDFPSNDSSD